MNELTVAYLFQIIWALFLGGMLAFGFRSSWNAENGQRGLLSETRSGTEVWIDPIVFPILIVIYVAAYMTILNREGQSLSFLIGFVSDIFLFTSIYFILLLLILPVLRKYFTARMCATLWLIPVFLFYQPQMLVMLTVRPPAAVIYIPGGVMRIVVCIWAVGAILIMGIQTVSHLWFSAEIKKHSRPVTDLELTEKWENLKEEMGLDIPIRLWYCSTIKTPLSIGMRKKNKITCLPEKSYTAEEVELIFLHELHHIQRNDTHTKFFLKFCTALGWFQPFIWIAVKKAEADLELSCDEIVLKGAGIDRRRKYAEMLLTTAGEPRGFTTCLSASAESLRYRMRSTLNEKEKRIGAGLLFSVMFFSCFCVGKTAFSTDRDTLGNILGTDPSNITSVFYSEDLENGERTEIADREGLLDHISGIRVDRLLYRYEMMLSYDEPVVLGTISSDDTEFTLFGEYLEIVRYGTGETLLYHVVDPIDWEYVSSL